MERLAVEGYVLKQYTCRYYELKEYNSLVELTDIMVVYYWIRFSLWCLTPLATIFQLYRGSQFYL